MWEFVALVVLERFKAIFVARSSVVAVTGCSRSRGRLVMRRIDRHCDLFTATSASSTSHACGWIWGRDTKSCRPVLERALSVGHAHQPAPSLQHACRGRRGRRPLLSFGSPSGDRDGAITEDPVSRAVDGHSGALHRPPDLGGGRILRRSAASPRAIVYVSTQMMTASREGYVGAVFGSRIRCRRGRLPHHRVAETSPHLSRAQYKVTSPSC